MKRGVTATRCARIWLTTLAGLASASCYSARTPDDAGVSADVPMVVDAGTSADAEDDARIDASCVARRRVGQTVDADGICAISAGNVYVWGNNRRATTGDVGRLDPESREPSWGLPRRVEGIEGAVSVGCDRGGSGCALLADGTVGCWGDNSRGQLGDGTRVSRAQARRVPGVAQIVDMSVGEAFTCVLDGACQARCWGYSGPGGSGPLSGVDCEFDSCPTPRPVAGLGRDIVDIATDLWEACALAETGEVRCVGGRYRVYATEGVLDLPEPATGFSSGYEQICAIGRSGAVYCPQLSDVAGWLPAVRRDDLSDVGWLQPDFALECAVLGAGQLMCHGHNKRGELGMGRLSEEESWSVLALVASEVSISWDHACARGLDGAVYCWGLLAYGMNGNTSPTYRLGATDVRALPPVGSLTAGGAGYCAVTLDGVLWCWGREVVWPNMLALPLSGWPGTGPFRVEGLADVQAVSAGAGRGCVLSTMGLRCSSVAATPADPVDAPVVAGPVAIAVTENHACAIEGTGRLMCWGDGAAGQLGDGVAVMHRSTPGSTVPAIDDATAVAVRPGASCVLRRGGEVDCFGSWSSGLGLPSGSVRRPTPVVGLADATSVDLGPGFGCALSAERGVLCWGTNTGGMLVAGGAEQLEQATIVPGLPPDIIQVDAGDGHVCAVTRDGRVWCWGDNSAGELGDGSLGARATPIVVEGIDDVLEIAVGRTSTCARRAGGVVSCWGSDEEGQLGQGTEVIYPSPHRVELPP